MYVNSLDTLPFTKADEMKKESWSFVYAYNLRTLRDIFVYINRLGKTNKARLYEDLKNNLIHAPRDRWVSWKNKDNNRLRLEYLHAAEYLGLVRKENGFIVPDFSEFEKEKKIIILENKDRMFVPQNPSPPFSKQENHALLRIILNFERALDFLRWFLDFSKFKTIYSFDEELFRQNAKPIFIFGKIPKGKKAPNILKREIDGKIWKIPDEDPYDYTRFASFVLPSWFKELNLIDEVIVFPEFSEDGKLWHMLYPLKNRENGIFTDGIFKFWQDTFKEKRTKKLWTPYLIFLMAQKFGYPVAEIKALIEKTYNENKGSFYLERTSAHLMKTFYKESYIEVGGFYRSYLNLLRMKNNGEK